MISPSLNQLLLFCLMIQCANLFDFTRYLTRDSQHYNKDNFINLFVNYDAIRVQSDHLNQRAFGSLMQNVKCCNIAVDLQIILINCPACVVIMSACDKLVCFTNISRHCLLSYQHSTKLTWHSTCAAHISIQNSSSLNKCYLGQFFKNLKIVPFSDILT